MTSLPSLIISFAIVGALLTAWTVWAQKQKHVFWTFLQHFCGVWFIFSGLVKAVDPIGTAYKMEDYFAAFEQTFEGLHNVFAGIAPLFPWLAKSSEGFSIVMISWEIILGVMLIIGFSRKLTAWLFSCWCCFLPCSPALPTSPVSCLPTPISSISPNGAPM